MAYFKGAAPAFAILFHTVFSKRYVLISSSGVGHRFSSASMKSPLYSFPFLMQGRSLSLFISKLHEKKFL
jgi:hypothetical protein